MATNYIYSVREAAQIAFIAMSDHFWNYQFCKEVRKIRGSEFLGDATILNKLRQLRNIYKVINYKSSEKGRYTKLCSCTKLIKDIAKKRCLYCKLELSH